MDDIGRILSSQCDHDYRPHRLVTRFSPNPEAPAKMMGTANALKLIISGFSSPAMILVGAAMFISVAMRKTGS